MAIGPWQLLIVLVIVVQLFGTKKLASLGTDLGGAMKGFKKAIKDDDEEATTQEKVAADDENKSN
jgi:sec-independent protein translocase protein TatA